MELRSNHGTEPLTGKDSLSLLDLSGWFSEEDSVLYASMVRSIHDGVVVEVGTWKGRSLTSILDLCKMNHNQLFAVDTFTGDPEYPPALAEANDTDIEMVLRRNLAILGHEATVSVLREPSTDAAARFADGTVNLVFLDGDHRYQSVLADLKAWLPKIEPGGILCGHDYDGVHHGVRQAVDQLFGSRVCTPPNERTSIWVLR